MKAGTGDPTQGQPLESGATTCDTDFGYHDAALMLVTKERRKKSKTNKNIRMLKTIESCTLDEGTAQSTTPTSKMCFFQSPEELRVSACHCV